MANEMNDETVSQIAVEMQRLYDERQAVDLRIFCITMALAENYKNIPKGFYDSLAKWQKEKGIFEKEYDEDMKLAAMETWEANQAEIKRLKKRVKELKSNPYGFRIWMVALLRLLADLFGF